MSGELEDDYELHNINISKIEGSRYVVAPDVPTDPMIEPLNIKKFNICMDENLNFANVRDYSDEETMAKIMDLLHEFQDLFLTKF